MAWTKDYRLHSIRFFPDGNTSAIVFGGVTNVSLPANPEVLAEISAGEIYPGAASLQTLRPVLSFSSFDLLGLWATGDPAGPGLNGGSASCVHSTTNVGLELYFAKWDCAGADTAATDHLRYTIGEGIIVPTTFNVDHRGNAVMSYDIFMVSDGAADPVLKADVAHGALPTHTNNNYRWTMDKMSLTDHAGAAEFIEGKRNISIAFNPSVTQAGADSETFDSVSSVDSFRPRVTVSGVDPDWLATTSGALTDELATLNGHTVVTTASETIMYLKERNGAANDLSVSFAGLLNWDNVISGEPQSPAETGFSVDVTKPDPGTAAFIVNTNATIP